MTDGVSRTCPGCFELRAFKDFCYVTPGGNQAAKKAKQHRPKKRCRHCFHIRIPRQIAGNHASRMISMRMNYGLDLETLGALWRSQGRACVYCGKALNLWLKRHYEIDHIVPRANGGDESLENLQILCRTCNQGKRALSETEFLAWIARVAGHALS